MKKKYIYTGNFGIDEYYYTLNSPFVAEKRVKWFETFTVYSISIREAFKLEKNDKYSISLQMHAKPSFVHRLQTGKIASSGTSAQNNGPWV